MEGQAASGVITVEWLRVLPAPGLLGDGRWQFRLHGLDRLQLAACVVAGGIEPGHIDPGNPGQTSQAFTAGQGAGRLEGIDEGGQQQLAVAEQHHVEEGRERFGIGGEHRAAAEHDRIVLPPLVAPQGDPLPLQQVQQHRAIQFPAQRQPEQFAGAVGGVPLIGEQPTHVQVGAAGQAGPDHLIPKTGDAHRIAAGKGQHGAKGIGGRDGRLEQQGFLVQGKVGEGSSSVSPC